MDMLNMNLTAGADPVPFWVAAYDTEDIYFILSFYSKTTYLFKFIGGKKEVAEFEQNTDRQTDTQTIDHFIMKKQ